jgi:hypothetical protein
MKSKVYELSDGTEITARGLADRVDISITTARCRLCRTRDPSVLFKPALGGGNSAKSGHFKVYTLDDGSQWTIPEIVKKSGITKQCAAARLHKSRSAEKVLKIKVFVEGEDNKRIRGLVSERMIFDPDGFWKIFNKAV